MNQKHLILFIFFVFNGIAISQAQIVDQFKSKMDSAKWSELRKKEMAIDSSSDLRKANGYYILSFHLARNQKKIKLAYVKYAKDLYEKISIDSMVAKCNFQIGSIYLNKGEFNQAEAAFIQAKQYFDKAKNVKKQIRINIKLASAKRSQGNLDGALSSIFKAKSMEENRSTPIHEMGEIYYWVVLIYNRMHDQNSSLKYAEEYLNAVEKSQDFSKRFYPSILIEAATSHIRNRDTDLAEIYYKKAIPFSSSNRLSVAHLYSHLANLNIEKRELETALTYIDSSLMFSEKASNKFLAAVYNQKYDILIRLGRKEEAKQYPFKALSHADKDHAWNHLLNSLESVSEISYTENKYKDAYLYLKRMDSIKSFLHSDKMAHEVRNLEKQLIEEQKQKEIVSLQVEKNKVNSTKNIFGALLGFAFLASLGLIYLLRKRSQYNKELKAKNETIEKALTANKMLMKEIHHRVKNNLQVVSSLLGLQSRYVNDDNALEAIKTGRSRVQSMSILHQNLYSNDLIKNVDIKKYFEDLGSNLFNTYNLGDKEIEFQTEIDDIELDVDTVIPMGLITNELISNALKYAFENRQKGVILLKVKQLGNKILLHVSDNGKGMPFDTLPKRSNSLGIQLIKSFAEKLEADVLIKNKEGAQIEFTFNKSQLISKTA